MTTSYDEIFECFLENCGIDTSMLPTTNEAIYRMIKNAVRHYNTYIPKSDKIGAVSCDDDEERINVKLDDARLLILAYCLKYVYLENQLVGFQELWSPFIKEIGFKDYKAQVEGRENTLKRTKNKIIELIGLIEDLSIM